MKKLLLIILLSISFNLYSATLTISPSKGSFVFQDEKVNISYPSLYFSFKNDFFSLSDLSTRASLQSLLKPSAVFLNSLEKRSVKGLEVYGLSFSTSDLSIFILNKGIFSLSIVYEIPNFRIATGISKNINKKEKELFKDPSLMGKYMIFNNTIQYRGSFYQISLASSHSAHLPSKFYFSFSLYYHDLSLYYLRGNANTINFEKDIIREAYRLNISNKVFSTDIIIKKGSDPIRPSSYRTQEFHQKTKLFIDKYFFQSEYLFAFTQSGRLTKNYVFSLGDGIITIKTDNKLSFSLELRYKELSINYKKGEIDVNFDYKVQKNYVFKASYSSKGILSSSISLSF